MFVNYLDMDVNCSFSQTINYKSRWPNSFNKKIMSGQAGEIIARVYLPGFILEFSYNYRLWAEGNKKYCNREAMQSITYSTKKLEQISEGLGSKKEKF